LLATLKKANNDSERTLFRDYVTEIYTDDNGVDEFVIGQTAEVKRDGELLQIWQAAVALEDKRTLWNVDSISLIVGKQIINNDSIKFSTVMIDSLSDRGVGFYAWREDLNSVSFTYSISPSSRILDTLYAIPIDPLLVEQRLINLHYLADSIGVGKRIWVLNSTVPGKEDKYKAQIFITDLKEGTQWSKTLDLPEPPRSLLVDDDSQKITVLGANDAALMMFDKYGEIETEPNGKGADENNEGADGEEEKEGEN